MSLQKIKNTLSYPFFLKNLKEAHKVAHGASKGACAEGGQGKERLLVVEDPKDRDSSETVMRSLDELQPGGTVRHFIPHREDCAYILFQGESAKSCLFSNLLLLSIRKLEKFPWREIVTT